MVPLKMEVGAAPFDFLRPRWNRIGRGTLAWLAEEDAQSVGDRKPAVMIHSSKVYITSFRSSGASVRPDRFQRAICGNL